MSSALYMKHFPPDSLLVRDDGWVRSFGGILADKNNMGRRRRTPTVLMYTKRELFQEEVPSVPQVKSTIIK